MNKKLIKVSDKYPKAIKIEEEGVNSLFFDAFSETLMNVNKAGYILREWKDELDLSDSKLEEEDHIQDYYGEE